MRLTPDLPERLPWVFIPEPNLFTRRGVDIWGSLQSPCLLASNNLCLLAKRLCLENGLLTEPVGYPRVWRIQVDTLACSVHQPSYTTNTVTQRSRTSIYQCGVCVKHLFVSTTVTVSQHDDFFNIILGQKRNGIMSGS